MAVKKEKFCDEKIEKLKQYLLFYHKLNEPVDFEIVLDEFKAVRRTSDPTHFDNYKFSLEKDSKEMIVKLYSGKSNNCDKMIFSFGE